MRFMFVDDECKVLEGLERSLMMVADDDWDLDFVEGGVAAIERLRAASYDAVVTDMRMPGLDGAEVLRQLQSLAPNTARIVLSGQMEDASALKALAHAHQILSKPCGPGQLCDVLRSAVRYRGLLENEAFRQAVITLDRLPASPGIYREIQAELRRPEPSMERLSSIAARDPGLTARLVQVSNSSFFGGGRRITTAAGAITRLGVNVLAALSMAAVFDRREYPASGFDLSDLQVRAVRTAELAGRLWPADTGLAYLAGIVTEVGHLVVAAIVPEKYDLVDEELARGGSRDAVERACWGTTHAEIGAYLMALWGLPHAVVEAVGHHHGAPAFASDLRDPGLAAAVACAAAVVDGVDPDPMDLQVLGRTEAEVRAQYEEGSS